MSRTDLKKTGDLDLQGQIGLETKKFCVITCMGILPSIVSCVLII